MQYPVEERRVVERGEERLAPRAVQAEEARLMRGLEPDELRERLGREEVEAAGGRVLSLPFVDGCSTSDIVDRIREA